MVTPEPDFDDEHDFDRVTPECRATVEAVQSLLDGEGPDPLDSDPHAGTCAACGERIRAARVLLAVLAARGPNPVPVGFADRVMNRVRAAERAQFRAPSRRVSRTAARFALAAAVLIAAFVVATRFPKPGAVGPNDVAEQPKPELAPETRAKALTPHPIRINDEVAKAGQALRDTPKPFTDSVAAAPKLFEAFATALSHPVEPMGDVLEPARKSLAELPDAARTGLEPVTGTAQKAFDRLLRDVAAMKPRS
ncbi:hypothetical protein GobsT_27020 [Gemmata obscuriglobus]|uniref:Zinc-finger domain-containing protein n=1 Tax=Gemmata obscuriglobus TaxID=114 RepID=A0A2Z3GX31_9BACT|nr:hypothetical protein [Gemmata obscuriglobus]AWM39029.1 hypothetical protein C1280_19965 [Gemmata obscuriglobus]QEG27938.1 hypothetical protein GobsT_27020 [Gemmata obscuriglobus]VTS05402.1 unnamed protein product [Gemmata obscuriglobus UQM 2246]